MISQKALLRGEETKAVEKLSNVLTRLSKSELESFQKLFAQMLDRIDDKSYRNECPGSQSDDTFLYARCFVIGRGREHFYKVLHNPKLMPKGEESFEHLLQLIDDIEVDDDFLKLGAHRWHISIRVLPPLNRSFCQDSEGCRATKRCAVELH